MEYEIEVPKGFLHGVRITLALIVLTGLGFLGHAVSPVGEDGKPQFLTPRLARITSYQRDSRRWVGNLQDIQADLGGLISNPPGDLLDLDSQANLLYGRLVSLQAEVDSTAVPPTLESLHAEFVEAVNATLEAAMKVATWISAPTVDNLASAKDALDQASAMLDMLCQNPWVQEER
jgi:hypothetical protein